MKWWKPTLYKDRRQTNNNPRKKTYWVNNIWTSHINACRIWSRHIRHNIDLVLIRFCSESCDDSRVPVVISLMKLRPFREWRKLGVWRVLVGDSNGCTVTILQCLQCTVGYMCHYIAMLTMYSRIYVTRQHSKTFLGLNHSKLYIIDVLDNIQKEITKKKCVLNQFPV